MLTVLQLVLLLGKVLFDSIIEQELCNAVVSNARDEIYILYKMGLCIVALNFFCSILEKSNITVQLQWVGLVQERQNQAVQPFLQE